MSQRRPDLNTGLLKFSTLDEVMKYLKEASEYYQKESEKYGDKLGSALRSGPGEQAPPKEEKKNDKKVEQKRVGAGGWIKMGSLMLSTSNPASASSEVMYQVHEELKSKLTRTNDAIKSLEQNAAALIPQGATFLVYVRNGVPERVIVEAQEGKKKAAFAFDARFRVV
jgi:hypothetical protein